jgi:hypothetical protein
MPDDFPNSFPDDFPSGFPRDFPDGFPGGFPNFQPGLKSQPGISSQRILPAAQVGSPRLKSQFVISSRHRFQPSRVELDWNQTLDCGLKLLCLAWRLVQLVTDLANLKCQSGTSSLVLVAR